MIVRGLRATEKMTWLDAYDEEWHTGGVARVPFGNVQAVMKSLNQTTDRTGSVASKAAE